MGEPILGEPIVTASGALGTLLNAGVLGALLVLCIIAIVWMAKTIRGLYEKWLQETLIVIRNNTDATQRQTEVAETHTRVLESLQSTINLLLVQQSTASGGEKSGRTGRRR
jgi:hypothetical protein